ncbi:MAG: NBR1-Ig-like domain-containing protein, partial [Anaerolineae bacterium]|nr:NBR1-Ig-like domain-containing protein [Anaerolineae bacterium]
EAGCTLDAAYVADVTIPDDTELAGGSAFVKTWRIRNIGTCDWEAGYQLGFSQGDQLGGPALVALPALAGGAQGDVSVDLVAPVAPGSYKGRWRLRAEGGTIFGQSMTVVIIVPGPPTMTPSATPTLTPSPTGTPTVTPSATPTSGFIITPMLVTLVPVFFTYTEQVYAQVSVPAGSTGNATAACPSGSILVSGGFAVASLPDMFISTHSMNGNGWRAYAKNDTGSSRTLTVYAVCLHNAAGGATTQVSTQVTAAANSLGHAVVACPAGSTVMGGGWATTEDDALHVFNSSMSGNGWQVWARNSTGGGKLMIAYAICLSGVSGTVSQVLNSVTVPGNAANAYTSECSTGAVVGGGFAANPDLHIYSTSRHSTGQRWSVAAKNTVGTDELLYVYSMCFKRTW